MKEYNMKVSRTIATFMIGRENTIVHDKNKPVILLYADWQNRILHVRNLTLWEKLCLFLNDNYKSYETTKSQTKST